MWGGVQTGVAPIGLVFDRKFEDNNGLDKALTKTFKRHVAGIYDLANLSEQQLVALHAKLSKEKKPTSLLVMHLRKN